MCAAERHANKFAARLSYALKNSFARPAAVARAFAASPDFAMIPDQAMELEPEQPGSTSGTASVPNGGPRRRVLLADDNEDALLSLSMLLQMEGHEVHTANNGGEALAAAERERPQIIILDIGMPEPNGYEVCRQLRKTPWGQQASIVAVTGWGQADDRQSTAEAGFDRHLVKPVDIQTILELVAARG